VRPTPEIGPPSTVDTHRPLTAARMYDFYSRERTLPRRPGGCCRGLEAYPSSPASGKPRIPATVGIFFLHLAAQGIDQYVEHRQRGFSPHPTCTKSSNGAPDATFALRSTRTPPF